MNSIQIRQTFLDFFKSKEHTIVPSAPMVVKNDPTLMFTNAGMNQFKDIFLGNSPVKSPRIANTQKCLRVSGKHNDLEEVGLDTYHHTMFEMLGNWSFGDYFKKEAIEWAWELLTSVYKIDKKNLYVTVFGGDSTDKLEKDDESYKIWENICDKEHIIFGSKKDNFWEMGDSGPCGPCSEIHIDIRNDNDKQKINGKDLVNTSHPLVIEIWNLVFMQYNRKADGSLEPLPAKHVDTGMGFERLSMVLQGKQSNYDTDIFMPIIQTISDLCGIPYGKENKSDIAMRVIADHLRAVSFAIADGQLPSNNKAGYVIRRILRRAVRYGYTFLNLKEPFLNELLLVFVNQFKDIFPETLKQQEFIRKVITEEEISFLRTLATGIHLFEKNISGNKKIIDGRFAFELFDTYGFPVDLTQLMAREKGMDVDMDGFKVCMEEQKNRSRQAAAMDTDDWILINEEQETQFVGYDSLEAQVKIIKYRKITQQNTTHFQLVLDKTPFYAESGGQVGDKGYIQFGDEQIIIENTQKENNLTVHIINQLPENLAAVGLAKVDENKRNQTAANHSATHLLHASLKQILGGHVEQKGSSVDDSRLRFDFTHFSKMSSEEIKNAEKMVNKKIRQNILLNDYRDLPIEEAQKMGATALFGEKYGDKVRVVVFDPKFSMEFCGGTHVQATGQIGFFKIISEGAIAAGIRRIEAITGTAFEEYFSQQEELISEIKSELKNPKNILSGIQEIIKQHHSLEKEVASLKKEKSFSVEKNLLNQIENINGINFIAAIVDLDTDVIKDMAFRIKQSVENLFMILGNESEGKANLTLLISENLVKDKNLNASKIIREIAKEINGGGGGQDVFATAGGKNPAGLENALSKAKKMIS